MYNKEELKVLKKFNLSPEQSVFLNKFQCFYLGGNVPIPGHLYVFNDRVGFRSKLNSQFFLGKAT